MPSQLYAVGTQHIQNCKQADAPKTVFALSGKLYLSHSGWLLLTVPNALARGVFDALNETGTELPPGVDGAFTAHISVMNKEEVDKIGPDKINERGHNFSYTLGPLKVVTPAGWSEMSDCWLIECQSPALKKLRISYGLTALPHGDHQFHISVGVRRRGVLHHNGLANKGSNKAAGILFPMLAAGGLVTDVAGLKAMAGEKEQASDPASTIQADTSYLDPLRKKKKKQTKMPTALRSAIAPTPLSSVPRMSS